MNHHHFIEVGIRGPPLYCVSNRNPTISNLCIAARVQRLKPQAMTPRLVITALCICLSLAQCHDDESSSCTDNPAEDLPWLKQKIEVFESNNFFEDASVFQGRYESKPAFMIVVVCETCYMAPAF